MSTKIHWNENPTTYSLTLQFILIGKKSTMYYQIQELPCMIPSFSLLPIPTILDFICTKPVREFPVHRGDVIYGWFLKNIMNYLNVVCQFIFLGTTIITNWAFWEKRTIEIFHKSKGNFFSKNWLRKACWISLCNWKVT